MAPPDWHPQILADQLTLSQVEGADYAHNITTGIPGFSDLPTALHQMYSFRSRRRGNSISGWYTKRLKNLETWKLSVNF